MSSPAVMALPAEGMEPVGEGTMFFFDPMYLLFMLPALGLALFAQWRVKSAYDTMSQKRNARNITGEDAAAYLLSQVGLAGRDRKSVV